MAEGERRTYRSTRQAVGIIAVAVIGSALMLSEGWQKYGGRADWTFRAFSTAFVVVAVSLCACVARSRVVADAEGVTVINPFRSVRLPWDRVDRFSEGSWRFVTRVGYVCDQDGVATPMLGTAGPNANRYPADRLTRDMVDRLNAELDEHRAQTAGVTRS